MNKSIRMLRKGFESSSTTTPEFAQFFRTFKSEFTKELLSISATDIVFSRGHFYLSGFFTIGSQPYYFSLSDVRGMEHCLNQFCMGQLLYRTAKHYRDFTGGSNQYVNIKSGMAKKLKIFPCSL
jgi:hypothetical protein